MFQQHPVIVAQHVAQRRQSLERQARETHLRREVRQLKRLMRQGQR